VHRVLKEYRAFKVDKVPKAQPAPKVHKVPKAQQVHKAQQAPKVHKVSKAQLVQLVLKAMMVRTQEGGNTPLEEELLVVPFLQLIVILYQTLALLTLMI